MLDYQRNIISNQQWIDDYKNASYCTFTTAFIDILILDSVMNRNSLLKVKQNIFLRQGSFNE